MPGSETVALYVFENEVFRGRFTRDAHGRIEFTYDSAPGAPISLSLPRHEPHAKNAAANFLDNLLPDNSNVRVGWARRLGVPNSPFDLLSRLGEDVAGALTLSPTDAAPAPQSRAVRLASQDEIAARVSAIIADPSAWIAPSALGESRMSLAGVQGKFTLARIDGQWFWPTRQLASTHILKPAMRALPDVPQVEAGSLLLARRLGIEAPRAQAVQFLGEPTFIVDRFDRAQDGGRVRRIPTEDIAQGLGLSPERKYGVTALQVVHFLRPHVDEHELYRFVEMLAFNTGIGNADAHAKNYSVFLERTVQIAPLYDSIPTSVWPTLSKELAMSISGARLPQAVTESHWAKFARTAGLDPERVVDISRRIKSGIRELAHDAYEELRVSSRMLSALDELVSTTTGDRSPRRRRPRPQVVDVAPAVEPAGPELER